MKFISCEMKWLCSLLLFLISLFPVVSFGQTSTIINEAFSSTVPSGWTAAAELTLNFNYGSAHSGSYCIRTTSNVCANNYNKYVYIPISVVSGGKYDVSFWVKGACNAQVYINETADQVTPLYSYAYSNACGSSAWQQAVCTQWTSTYDGTVYVEIAETAGYGCPSYFYIDDVVILETTLEPTSNPSSFTATPAATCTDMDLNFSAASTISYAKGYLILKRQGAAPTGVPSDGTSYSVGATIGDATVAANVYSTSTTTVTVSGLTGATNYYFSIIPYNYNGSNASSYNYKTATFATTNATTNACVSLATEPSANPASFTATTATTCEQIDLGFSAASTITNCYGYLILRKEGSSSSAAPADANGYTVGSTIGDATLIADITNTSATTYNDQTGLYDNTAYYYYIFPYNYDGSNALSYNYLTTGTKSANATTKYCPVLIGNQAGGGATWDDPAIAHHGNNANWWAVNLYTKTEMNSASKKITSICLDLNLDATHWYGTPNRTMTNSYIWMANYSDVSTFPSEYTTEAALDAGTGVTWTKVYDGAAHSITYSNIGWWTINLDVPFNYSGTGSLLVKFTRVSGNTNTTYPLYGIVSASPTSQIRQLNSSYSGGSPNPVSYKYSEMAFNSDCSTGDVVLPVTFTRFSGTCFEKGTLLTWQTATEQNNEKFIVERSNDGESFETIGIVAGAGNSSHLLNYSFTDSDPAPGISYYRLTQQDFNGETSSSAVIAVDRNCISADEAEITLYPNPADEYFDLDLTLFSDAEGRGTLFDQTGRPILYIPVGHLTSGLNSIRVLIGNLGAGIYFLKMNVGGKDYVKKVVKL